MKQNTNRYSISMNSSNVLSNYKTLNQILVLTNVNHELIA